MVENRANFIPHLYLAPPQWVTSSEFREDLGIHKTRLNGLSCGEEIMTIYSAVLIVVVVVIEYLYSASRSASNALIVPQRCEEMCL